MISGTPTQPVPEHDPELGIHYYFRYGWQMTNAERRDYAKNLGINGARCRTCQSNQGGRLSGALKNLADAFGLGR